MKLTLIRHGKTKGNTQKRYIGRTDEELCEEGKAELAAKWADKALFPKTVIVSPMKRAKQTAELLFPGVSQIEIPEFREMDFGDFEGKNYAELNGNADYQAWIDAGGTTAFPGGEDRETFIARTMKGYERLKALQPEEPVVAVVHGGTIMALCSQLLGGDYFDYQIGCGECYDLD